MASAKERRDKIPSPARYVAIITAAFVGAIWIVDLIFGGRGQSWTEILRYISYGAAAVALLINAVVYYYQAKG